MVHWQGSPCYWDDEGVLDAQPHRGNTEDMEVNRLVLLENPHMIKPHLVRMNQSERRIPVALGVPYPYVGNLLALESYKRQVVLLNQLRKINHTTEVVGVGGSSDLAPRCRVS